MITIIDYSMGNLGSIKNMIKKAGAEAVISSDPSVIEQAQKIVLAGVGSFDAGIENLKSLSLIDILNKKIIDDKIPTLGICLGMQLFTRKSEEGELPGLAYIQADTKKFSFDQNALNRRIPHMGWDTVTVKKNEPVLSDADDETMFYFVHSYHAVCDDSNDVLTSTNYGYEFTSAFSKENIIGVQFHPEKSHKFGINFFKNFIEKY